ncbi:copper chaperone PCu(A)C [Microcella sp.]|uniref:copper chaperone PCu(A)C n=1 Tax=Microcella sp. TaxID=1913979 RepID=UPI002565668F|nr:copper chaperone PCu(A)C [Microcella sp.]MBX9472915.1 copper chaperone PCu(A)C [Microcella sp.]
MTFTTTTSTAITRRTRRRTSVAGGLALATALALTACAGAPVDGASPSAEVTSTAAESIQVVDGWVKAVDEGMTAAFGVLENAGDADVTLIAASADVSPMIELHEVVMSDGVMVMQQKQGGIVVAAGSRHELAPGNDHLMMMGVAEPLMPGDEVVITLEFSDGSVLEHAFTVKEFTGADEQYVGDTEDE